MGWIVISLGVTASNGAWGFVWWMLMLVEIMILSNSRVSG
jgi:hypothetical protein